MGRKGQIPWNKGLSKELQPTYGKKMLEATKDKIGSANKGRKINQGEKNPQWKGDKVKYGALHEWIRNRKSKPEFCEKCKKVTPYDLANKSGKYLRDINDYDWFCRKCHMESDGRMFNRNNKGDFVGRV